MTRIYAGCGTRNWSLRTAEGRFFVKEYPARTRVAEERQALELSIYARDCGIPTPMVTVESRLPSETSRWLDFDAADKLSEVERYVEIIRGKPERDDFDRKTLPLLIGASGSFGKFPRSCKPSQISPLK